MKYNLWILLANIFIMSACTNSSHNTIHHRVSVSIAPQKFFVEQLAGDSIEVNVMIPPGTGHETYAPTPGQLMKLNQSDAYLAIGHISFEKAWRDKIMETNENLAWIDLSEGIQLIQGEHDHHHHGHDHHSCGVGVDPHIWTSPKEALSLATNTKDALVSLYPNLKDSIEVRFIALTEIINQFDQRLTTIGTNKPGMSFMIFHPAYTYLAKAYGMEQLTIEFEGKTPSPAKLRQTIEAARTKNIKTIYIQQEFDQENAAVVAKEIGASTAQVNPLSADWTAEMERFITHLENN